MFGEIEDLANAGPFDRGFTALVPHCSTISAAAMTTPEGGDEDAAKLKPGRQRQGKPTRADGVLNDIDVSLPDRCNLRHSKIPRLTGLLGAHKVAMQNNKENLNDKI
jgi:hypothetical protein